MATQLLVAQIWLMLLQTGTDVSRSTFLVLAEDMRGEADLGTAYDELVYLIGQWAKL